MPIFNETEKVFIRYLTDQFETGNRSITKDINGFSFDDRILARNQAEPLLKTLEGFEAIVIISESASGSIVFNVTHMAVQLAREMERNENERRDIVDEVYKGLRTSWFAWAFIVFFGIVAVLTGLNQAVSVLQNIGLTSKP